MIGGRPDRSAYSILTRGSFLATPVPPLEAESEFRVPPTRCGPPCVHYSMADDRTWRYDDSRSDFEDPPKTVPRRGVIAENVYDAENEQLSGGERLVTNLLLIRQHGAGYNIGTLITLAPTGDRQGPQEVFMLCLLGRLIRFLLVVLGLFVATAVGRGSDGSD